jgi:hypothetical protein
VGNQQLHQALTIATDPEHRRESVVADSFSPMGQAR